MNKNIEGDNNPNYKHGGKGTRLYRIWKGMKNRCSNPNSPTAKWYFKKGISLHEEWKKFEPFKEWADSSGYSDLLTIDRVNSSGNYCPDNCRWVDMITQNNNKSSNRTVEIDGKIFTASELCKIYNIKLNTLLSRLNANWTINKLLIPSKGRGSNQVTYG